MNIFCSEPKAKRVRSETNSKAPKTSNDYEIHKYVLPLAKVTQNYKNLQVTLEETLSLQRGTKSHLKKQSQLKSQFLPEMTLLKSQQNFQNQLKPNFLLTPILNICFKKFSI